MFNEPDCDLKTPIYDIHKTYLENAQEGPFFPKPLPKKIRPPKEQWTDFLGFKVATPIGIPAGPLLNAKWVDLAGRLGYDVLCYKTIRSQAHPGHPLPNIVYVEANQQLIPSQLPPYILRKEKEPQQIEDVAITNSFGMPSRSPEFLHRDISLAYSQLEEGQALIVSVVGTPPSPQDYKGFVNDFVAAARLAKQSGAQIIEANFSCPNVSSKEGCLYLQPEHVFEIASSIIHAIGDIPLIMKAGLFPDEILMQKTLVAAARAGVRAVSGINTIGMRVMGKDGKPALGADRPTSGICGNPIREAALDFVRKARQIIDGEKLGLTLLGCGGILQPEHFYQFLEAGADVALTATGMMWDPYLALRAQSYFHFKKELIDV